MIWLSKKLHPSSTTAGKGANDMCSMLKYYIDKIKEVECLNILGDNCSGQNKNSTLVPFIMALAEKKVLKKVKLYFPQRKHSFMPNDRDFGTIKRKLKKQTDIILSMM